VGRFVDERDPRGDGFMVALDVAGEMVFTFPLAYGESYRDCGHVPSGALDRPYRGRFRSSRAVAGSLRGGSPLLSDSLLDSTSTMDASASAR
jgi:hypothetical protein